MQLGPLSRIGILDAKRSDLGGVIAFFSPKSQVDDRKVLHDGLRCVRLFRTHGRALTFSLIDAKEKGLPARSSEIESLGGPYTGESTGSSRQ